MRTEFAAEIGRVREAVAISVTDALRSRHPDRLELHGDRVPAFDVYDARHHVDFLQAAVALDDPATFRDYALWCRDLLDSRGTSDSFLVESFEAIRDELADRLSPPASEAVGRALHPGLAALAAGEGSARAKVGPLSPACRLYLAASVSGRREAALEIVRGALRGGASPLDVYIDIFQCALHEVGRRWETSGLTIAEEHMATATTQFILSVLHEENPRTGSQRGTAVITGVVHEQHVVGASIVANVLDAEGWDVRFLGTNLPHDAIVSAIVKSRASLVAVSVTMSERVEDVRDLIAHIRRSSAASPRIIVGGAAVLRHPQVWRTMGADGFATDARSVAELARG